MVDTFHSENETVTTITKPIFRESPLFTIEEINSVLKEEKLDLKLG